MIPGPPEQLVCPHCGGLKHIQSIISGNTFCGTVWSDSKQEYPMLPSPSPVQRCPNCDSFFFYDDSSPHQLEEPMSALSWDDWTDWDNGGSDDGKKDTGPQEEARKNGFGELSFEETDAAFSLLYDSADEKRQATLLALWLFSYNDRFGGRRQEPIEVSSGGTKITFRIEGRIPKHLGDCPDNTKQRFRFVAGELCRRFPHNRLLVSELLRETGDFEGSIEVAGEFLTAINPDNPHQGEIARQIIAHARAGDRAVFALVFRNE